MLTLRLSRAGTKKKPVYHLIATDSRSRRDGRFIENLGYYVPARKILVLKEDRVRYWLDRGAQLSSTAQQLIRRHRKHQGFGAGVATKAGSTPEVSSAPTNVVVVQMSESVAPSAS